MPVGSFAAANSGLFGKDKFDMFNISALESVFWPNDQKINFETQMNEEKGLWLQCQCLFF